MGEQKKEDSLDTIHEQILFLRRTRSKELNTLRGQADTVSKELFVYHWIERILVSPALIFGFLELIGSIQSIRDSIPPEILPDLQQLETHSLTIAGAGLFLLMLYYIILGEGPRERRDAFRRKLNQADFSPSIPLWRLMKYLKDPKYSEFLHEGSIVEDSVPARLIAPDPPHRENEIGERQQRRKRN